MNILYRCAPDVHTQELYKLCAFDFKEIEKCVISRKTQFAGRHETF